MTFTALCFAGPLNGQFVSAQGSYLRCIPPTTEYLWDQADDQVVLRPRERTYRAETFTMGPYSWPAWLYEDGWIEDEPVERHVRMAVQVMWEIARAWNGVPVVKR